MAHRRVIHLIASAAVILWAGAAQAQSQLAERVPPLLPVAAKARQAVLDHPTLAPFELQDQIEQALTAVAMVPEGRNLYARKMAMLKKFEPILGPVLEIPSIRLHTIFGGVAAEEKLEEERLRHAAYYIALVKDMAAGDRDGSSPAKALRVVMVDDEYGYFRVMGIRVRPEQRRSPTVDGRTYDVWTLPIPSGGEARIWFDVTATQDAGERVLKSRTKESGEPKK